MRERLQNAKDGAAGGPGGAGIEARLRELRQQLALAPEQEAAFDEAVAAARQKLKPEGEPALPELLRQAREAAQGGDRQQAKDIRDRLEARRRAAESALREFQAAVEPVLNDQQKQTLKQFGQQAATALNPGKNDGAARNDPRMLLRAARRLDLTQEQKDQLDAIQKDLGERARQPGTEKPTPALLRSEIEKQIREILTPEQATQFDEILARQAKVGDKDGARRDKTADDGQEKPGEKPRRKAKGPPGEKQENP
ncbi:MAG: hypothetical protein HZB38_06415 [Planctomycetes bacterium]|nr:hypothetical protein [Planctomycetota bacterium]